MYIPDLIHIHRKPNNSHSYFTCIIYFHCMKTKYRVSFKIHVYMLLSIDCLKLNESQNLFCVKIYTNTLYWFNIQWFIGSKDQCWLCTYGALEMSWCYWTENPGICYRVRNIHVHWCVLYTILYDTLLSTTVYNW